MKARLLACGVALAAAGAGCQLLLGIDTDVPILDDGAAGGSSPSCAGADALLCDDFEEATIDVQRWPNVDDLGAAASIDASRANGGSHHSLHAQADSISQSDAGVVSGMVEHFFKAEAALPPHFFVRFFAYAQSPLPDATEPEILVNLQKQYGGGMQLYVQGGQLAFTSWANTPTLNVPTTMTFAADAWHCIEWEIVAAPSAQMNVWFDEQEVPSLSRADVVMAAYDDLKLGIAFGSPPAQAHNVWIDDVRVAKAKIGCH